MATEFTAPPSRKFAAVELSSRVFVPDRPDAVRAAKRYSMKIAFLRYGSTGLIVLFIVLMVLEVIPVWLAVVLAVAVLVGEMAWLTALGKSSLNILEERCDAFGAIAYTLQTVESFYRQERSCSICMSNVGVAAQYAGRVDDMLAVSQTLRRYFPTAWGAYLATSLEIEADIMRKDWDAFRFHYDTFVQTSHSIKKRNTIYLQKTLQYPGLVELYKRGDYPQLYDALCNFVFSRTTNSQEVRRNYYQCKVARLMGNWQLAEQHRNFVLAYGGNTCYRTELLNEPAPAPQQQPMPQMQQQSEQASQ